MKSFSSVLVLTNDEQSDLIETLLALGYFPLIRHKMVTALKEIQHKYITVIFLDLQCIEIDALEFVINVRDIDEHLPVVIVNGKKIEGEEEILNQRNIFLTPNALDKIKNILKVIL